MSVAGGG
ncbi:hypothetical protein YPPY03_1050, partial [Yersinia pestis PY-03]